jgi:exodeoxyribonuclease-1
MVLSYLFYDIETTGLNKCFDQVIQFAAIRTNLQLEEIERFEYQIRLNKDLIPDPAASLTHGCSIEQLRAGYNELEAIQQIHQLLNTPGTISIGYNSLKFDDEFLRFSFYRNLLPAYTHQYANQCSRMDLYPITILFYLFQPDALNWPIHEGKISFKLEKINYENNLAVGPPHQAMVDVEATLALAKKFFKFPEIWNYAASFFNKKLDTDRMQPLREAIAIDGTFGTDANFQAPILFLGQHYHYKNQFLWLRLDKPIAEQTYVLRKKAGELLLILPPLPRFRNRLSEEQKQLEQENKTWLENNPEVFHQISEEHRHYKYPKIPNLDVDAALYELGFSNSYEESLYSQFHRAEPQEKLQLAKKIPSPERRKLALRIMGRHHYEYLSSEEKQEFDQYLSRIFSEKSEELFLDYKGKTKRNASSVLTQIAELKQQNSYTAEQLNMLEELSQYIMTQTAAPAGH